jgi:molybdate transport system substrate-binding protein
VLLILVVLLHLAAPARADEVQVMVSGGFTAAYRILVAEWQKATGHTVTTVAGASMGPAPTSIPNRLARGEPADVVILAREALDGLVANGKVVGGSAVDLVRSRIGMAVKAGATAVDISTEQRFRQVLLDARSIAYSESASGIYISTEMFKKMGVEQQVAGKSKVIFGMVGEAIAKGDAEIGFQQISELLPVPGITLVGPIPDALQRVTIFSAGIAASARAPAAARSLIAFLASSNAWPTIRLSGLEPIAAR